MAEIKLKVYNAIVKPYEREIVIKGGSGRDGAKGDKGDKGDAGADGTTAYQAAVAGGYEGTEQEFNSKLNQAMDIASFEREVDSGKALIAEAITDKGVPATADESLSELSQDILNIPVEVQVEDAANLAFPESIAWNILKEAYAQQRVGYASWIVAEFFKGYDTIPLSGADAFYTCDGDFYTEATTHTWHDDSYNKVNRFVVYYFTGENVPFSVTQESICPRSMAVMGKFGSINIASAGRIRQIYNGGEINDISFASTNPDWGQEVLIGNIKEHNIGYLVNNNDNVAMIGMDIEILNGGIIVQANGISLTDVLLPKLKVINAGTIVCSANSTNGKGFLNLRRLSLPLLQEVNGGMLIDERLYGNTAIDTITLPQLTIITGNNSLTRLLHNVNNSADFLPNLTKLELPSLTTLRNAVIFGNVVSFRSYPTPLRELRMPSLITIEQQTISGAGNYDSLFQVGDYFAYMSTNTFSNLILIEIGQRYNGNLNLKNWCATNAIKDTDNSLIDEGETFANNREKFLYNFEKYIVDKLADNSTTGLSFTITLKTAVYNVVSATTAITDKLTAKHWNLASA